MNMNFLSSRKKIIVTLLIIVVIIVIAIAAFIPKNNNKPTVSKVTPGETITSDQIKQQNQNSSGSQSGSSGGSSNNSQQPPSSTDFYNTIVGSNKVASGVNFGIIRTENPMPGWYIVTIKATGIDPAKVIFEQTSNPNNPLTIVAGPGTDFSSIADSLPEPVRKALQ